MASQYVQHTTSCHQILTSYTTELYYFYVITSKVTLQRNVQAGLQSWFQELPSAVENFKYTLDPDLPAHIWDFQKNKTQTTFLAISSWKKVKKLNHWITFAF